MTRVKRGVQHSKHRRNILKSTKGYMWGRKSKIKLAKTAILKAGVNAYRDRRLKKRDQRGFWILRINAALRENGLTYSKFIDKLKKAGVTLDRKVLSEIAANHPEIFKKIVASV